MAEGPNLTRCAETCRVNMWPRAGADAGYGFVDFDTEQAAELAVKALKAEGRQAQMARVGYCNSFNSLLLLLLFILLMVFVYHKINLPQVRQDCHNIGLQINRS